MEIFDMPPMLKGNDQDLPSIRNYLVRIVNEIHRLETDLAAVGSIEEIVNSTKSVKDYVDSALKGKQNVLAFDKVPKEGSSSPVTSDGIKRSYLDMIYPVGSIYMSVNTNSPETFLGGTWERIRDRFLLAAGQEYAAGSTGGEAAHLLTVEELPMHNHYIADADEDGNGFYGTITADESGNYRGVRSSSISSGSDPYYTGYTGMNALHNNMPPYLAVYIWKRTA